MAASDYRTGLTANRLRELLHYDPDTGVFTWREGIRGSIEAGARAGCVSLENGIPYRVICVEGRLYREHRLAWLYVYGVWPKGMIDHKDGPSNAIGNLREATQTQNMANRRFTANKSGYKGVKKYFNKWIARVNKNGKNTHIGIFDTPEDAARAYDIAAVESYGEFARTNKMLGLID